ncbi:MAG: hypothetical protein Q4E55_00880 [Bacteroidales bacterium]|nr:hypothetical protein [Bacteroidales bacterium]
MTLQNALSEEYSQFIAVYGRRRVGKTFLVREAYDYKFASQIFFLTSADHKQAWALRSVRRKFALQIFFLTSADHKQAWALRSVRRKFALQFAGAAKQTARKQLVRFRRALKEHGQKDAPELTNWGDAFSELRRFVVNLPEVMDSHSTGSGQAGSPTKKVVFLDELPRMDAPRSGFLSEIGSFGGMGGHPRDEDIVFVACGSSDDNGAFTDILLPQKGWCITNIGVRCGRKYS